MSQYHYLISSLPFLDYSYETRITRSRFLEACADGCSENDYKLIEQISLVPESGAKVRNHLLARYYEWERFLRNELVRLRAKKKGQGFEKYVREDERPFSPQVIPVHETGPAHIARSAYQQESPIQMEESILRARWTFLDELETGHFFDLEKLIVYKLRLEILEQKAMIKEEKGRQNYQSVMEYFEKNIGS